MNVLPPPDLVYILDASTTRRYWLGSVIRAAGWRAVLCLDADVYRAQPRADVPSCLIADEAMTGQYAGQVQSLCSERPETPLICTALKPTVRAAVAAIRAGAFEFLPEPFEVQPLLGAVRAALDRSHHVLRQNANLQIMSSRYKQLSPRERQVMSGVVAGRLNKQIAHELGLSLITVKTHRGRVMRKMAASSLPELVNMAAHLG